MSVSESQVCDQFFALSSFDDVAKLLSVTPDYLTYCFRSSSPASRYHQFNIARKSGEPRLITAPAPHVKEIQRRLCYILQLVYKPKRSAHGFIIGKSIVTNAKLHVGRSFVLNVDVKDFFPSLHFGRVRGMFMRPPYNLNASVATILAQICCHDKQLPQGAPTSPVVANMICGRMDSELERVAKLYKCYYSRYADDISFSTRLRAFPRDLATLNSLGQLEVGHELKRLITNSNGFQINERKIRLQDVTQRQEVTGLTVNEKANVTSRFKRQIRGMLYAWHKHGIDNAQREFFQRYDSKQRSSIGNAKLFKRVLKGKIEFVGMVRGKTDLLYLRYCFRLAKLDPGLMPSFLRHQPIVDDQFRSLEIGLNSMLTRMGRSHTEYADATTLEYRLKENIASVRLFTDDASSKRERFQIVQQLNAFCLKVLITDDFTGLCGIRHEQEGT